MSPSEPAAGDIRRWRLRTRLALVMFFVFIPIFTLVVLTHISALKERRESRVESLKTLDQSIAASVDGFAQDLQSFAKSASITLTEASAAGFPISQENFGPYFVDLANSYNVRSIFVTDLNGRVIAGTTGNVGFDVSNRPYFATLRSGAETVWSGGLAGTLSGQTTLAYGRVVKSASGEPLVYFFVAFYPPQLSDRLPPDLPEDTNVALIDNGGVVLLSSHDLDPETPTRDVSGSPIFQQAAKGNEVVIRNKTTPVDEDKRYGAFVPIKSTGWVIGLTRPASAIDSPLQRRFRRDLAILGAAFFAGLVAMVASASRLSRPLAMLAGSAGAIARGETPAEFEYTKDSDLYQLQTAMASMGAAIAEREERLRGETRAAERMANQLARLHASRNALAALLPPAEISSIVVREAVRAIGAHTGAVFLPDFASGTFQLAGHIGYSEPVAEQLGELVMDERSPIRDAFREGEAIVFRDAGEQNKAYPQHAALKTAAGTQAVAFLPLKVQGETLGVLLLGFAQSQYFTQDDIDLMFALANQAAQALQRSQLYDQLVRRTRPRTNFSASSPTSSGPR
jgi:GAF domain/Cache domain